MWFWWHVHSHVHHIALACMWICLINHIHSCVWQHSCLTQWLSAQMLPCFAKYMFVPCFVCTCTTLMHLCATTHAYVCHDSCSRALWLMHMCAMTHWYVAITQPTTTQTLPRPTNTPAHHDSFICVPWLIHMCDMTHSYVWHNSFTCAPWLIDMCAMTPRYVAITQPTTHTNAAASRQHTCAPWLVHTCAMTHSWLIDMCAMTQPTTSANAAAFCPTSMILGVFSSQLLSKIAWKVVGGLPQAHQ